MTQEQRKARVDTVTKLRMRSRIQILSNPWHFCTTRTDPYANLLQDLRPKETNYFMLKTSKKYRSLWGNVAGEIQGYVGGQTF